MPIYYKDITPEHLAVRNGVGIFDISHMGRVLVTGIDAENFLNDVITNDVSTLQPNAAQYSVMCNENGGIMDDFVVYRLEDEKFHALKQDSSLQDNRQGHSGLSERRSYDKVVLYIDFSKI